MSLSEIDVISGGAGGGAGPAGPGVAAGGSTGQMLVKASAADYDTAWADAASGAFLPLAGGAMTGPITSAMAGAYDPVLSLGFPTYLPPTTTDIPASLRPILLGSSFFHVLNGCAIYAGRLLENGTEQSTFVHFLYGSMYLRNPSPGGGPVGISLTAYGEGTVGGSFTLSKGRGTEAAPTSALAGDGIRSEFLNAYDASNTAKAFAKNSVIVGDPAVATLTAIQTWSTVSNGSANTVRMRMDGHIVSVGHPNAPAALNANERFRVNTPVTADANAAATISASAAAVRPLAVQGAASQSADLTQWQDSTGAVLAKVGPTGSITAASLVLGNRATGWANPTGTVARTTFDTATATLNQVAQRLAALIADLTTVGLIGA